MYLTKTGRVINNSIKTSPVIWSIGSTVSVVAALIIFNGAVKYIRAYINMLIVSYLITATSFDCYSMVMTDLFSDSAAGQVDIGGVKVNRIGLGTNRVTDNPATREFLKFAVSSGVNFIDTAHVYAGGGSETTIGNSLAPFTPGLIVATKGGMGDGSTGNNSEEFLRENLETSLNRLQTQQIYLYQIHRVDPEIPIANTIELLKTFQAEGKIKHIGLSEVNVGQIEEAMRYTPIASVQNQYSLTYREYDDVLDYCTQNGIVFIPWFPLRDVNGDSSLQAKLRPIADKYSSNIQQIVLAWLLKKSPVMLPIPGTLSKDHLRDNIAASLMQLSDEDFARIDSIT